MNAVLAEMVVDSVRSSAAALAGVLNSGDGDDPELSRFLLSGRSYAELRAMVLLLADCADPEKVTQACGVNPWLAAGNARRISEARHRVAEYAWLRDGGVIPEEAARRSGIRGSRQREQYEQAYRAARDQQREEASAA